MVRWYDEAGAELSGSPTLDIRGLPEGQHTLRAVSVGGETVQSSRVLLVEKTGDYTVFLRDFPERGALEPHVHPHPAPPRGESEEV
jgi:hypothetical protein